MSRLLHIGLFTEGSTDVRFLESIVKRTFTEIAFDCRGDVDIEVSVVEIEKQTLGFTEQLLAAARKGGEELGIMVLCVHLDADDANDRAVFTYKINPAKAELEKLEEEHYCKQILPIVPVYMTEAWMLADPELLKDQIGTTKTNQELNLHRAPEHIVDPKATIKEAIRIARQEIVKRRRRDLSIGELYQPIGQEISLDRLMTLSSYVKFRDEVINTFRALHFMS